MIFFQKYVSFRNPITNNDFLVKSIKGYYMIRHSSIYIWVGGGGGCASSSQATSVVVSKIIDIMLIETCNVDQT